MWRCAWGVAMMKLLGYLPSTQPAHPLPSHRTNRIIIVTCVRPPAHALLEAEAAHQAGQLLCQHLHKHCKLPSHSVLNYSCHHHPRGSSHPLLDMPGSEYQPWPDLDKHSASTLPPPPKPSAPQLRGAPLASLQPTHTRLPWHPPPQSSPPLHEKENRMDTVDKNVMHACDVHAQQTAPHASQAATKQASPPVTPFFLQKPSSAGVGAPAPSYATCSSS